MKRWILLFNAVILACMLYGAGKISALTYEACDITKVNDRFEQAKDGLSAGLNRSDLEADYGCHIILMEDKDYMQEYYHAIRNGDLLLDYFAENKGEGNQGNLLGKIIFSREEDSFLTGKRNMIVLLIAVLAISMAGVNLLCYVLYRQIIRPFKRLERFAKNIAVGDLDAPLRIEKQNYFGAFTESFDIMRAELKKARDGEEKANKSKKELVASLSHDIKTPVATIKALCEVLEVKLSRESQNYLESEGKWRQDQAEQHKKEQDLCYQKIVTIEKKADVIDQLINNMFHVTLQELSVLKVNAEEHPSTILGDIIADSDYEKKVRIHGKIPGCLIMADPLRLSQVIDNILGNSYKYAKTPIDIYAEQTKDYLNLIIKDYGNNIEETDIALVCEKFYRGSNVANTHIEGSGLGLYLAKQFMEGMEGAITCEADSGFKVTLSLKKAGR